MAVHATRISSQWIEWFVLVERLHGDICDAGKHGGGLGVVVRDSETRWSRLGCDVAPYGLCGASHRVFDRLKIELRFTTSMILHA